MRCVSCAVLLDSRLHCAGTLRGKRKDFNGNLGTSQIFFSVEGQAKLGNYSVSFTDLSIPLAGIPIEITRTYDTLNAPFSGDFGFGWNLSIGEARIRETLPVTQAERDGVPALFGGAEPFFAGTRVYLTTPSGQRAGFTFDPVPEGGLLGTIWRPRFVADPGVLETLEVEDIPLSQRSDGTFGLYLFGLPYNPREYTLTTKDGVRYRYDQFDELLDVTDRNGVKLTYTDAGIFSSMGESIQFVRDSRGRISEIIDPAGNTIKYTYDAAGDLRSVTDQVSNTTTMDYRSDVPHFLERITGPNGNLINEVKYDEDNRFVALVDALGKEVQQEYDLDANTFIQTDRLGNPTTLIYDDRGNILQQTDALDNTTFFEYSDPRNPHLETAVTDARGNTTRMTYDSRGNMTLLEQPGGIFTRFEFDQFNNVTRTLGPSNVDPGDGYADTLIDSFFASGEILGAVVGERIANQDGELDVFETAETILGPEFDRNTQTPLDSDYIVFQNPGDYVTVAFDETVIDRPGDDIFIITPFFAANFDNINSTAEVFVSTDGTTFQSVGFVGEAGYNPIDLADFGITEEIPQVRVVGVSSDDPNALSVSPSFWKLTIRSTHVWNSSAKDDLSTSIELSGGKDSAAHVALGEVHFVAGEFDLSLANYEKATTLDGNPDALTGRAEVFLETQRVDDAIETCNTLTKTHCRTAYALRGWARMLLEEYREALEDFDTAVDLSGPGSGYAHYGRAWLLSTSPDDAIRDSHSAMAGATCVEDLACIERWRVDHLWGAVYANQNRWEQAVSHQQLAIKSAPAWAIEKLNEQLAGYRAHKPIRMPHDSPGRVLPRFLATLPEEER